MKAIAVLGAASPAALVCADPERLINSAAAPRHADDAALDTIETIVNHAKIQDDLLGPNAAIGTILSQARLTDSLLIDISPRLRDRALTLRCHIGVSAGWQCFDLGHHDAAAAHFTLAREAADEASAHGGAAMAMAEWSWGAGAIAATALAADLAAAAESRAASVSDARLRAHTAAIAGVALARIGNTAGAHAALTRAAMPDIDPVAGPAESIAYFCTPAHIARLRGEALRNTGDLTGAIGAANESIALRSHRDSAEAHLLLGTLHLDADNVDAAVDAFLTAIESAAHSPRLADQLRIAVTSAAKRVPSSSAAQLLNERLDRLG